MVVLVNFPLGLGSDHIFFRALKYVLAFVAMPSLNFLLSNVILGLAPASALQEVSVVVSELRELASAFYLMVLGPAFFGFLVGALIVLTRRWSPEK